MVQLVRSLLSSAVYHVGLSAFARLQNDLPALARAYVQATRISCLVGFPIGIGMALLGPLLIRALFGSKWDESTVLLAVLRSEEHTSELQSLMRISYAVFCLKKKKKR